MTTNTTPLPERRAVATRARIALDTLISEASRLHRDVNRMPNDDELAELEYLTARAYAALDTLGLK